MCYKYIRREMWLARLMRYMSGSSSMALCARNAHITVYDVTTWSWVNLVHPEFSGETLTSEREWQRAYVLVTFLAQAYIWMEGERGLPDRVPKILAVPWKETADHLGLAPNLYHICFKYFVQLEATGHQWING